MGRSSNIGLLLVLALFLNCGEDGGNGGADGGRDAIQGDSSDAFGVVDSHTLKGDGSDDTAPPCEGLCELSVYAGEPGGRGGVDGVGQAARFRRIDSIVGDEHYLYLSDYNNAAIRQLDLQTNEVKTIAGQLGRRGKLGSGEDGPGAQASFAQPGALTLLGDTLYLLDGRIVRRVEGPAAGTSTVATVTNQTTGLPWMVVGALSQSDADLVAWDPWLIFGDTSALWALNPQNDALAFIAGSLEGVDRIVDGSGPEARFGAIHGIASDGEGLVYVADGCVIRRVDTATGQVTTIAGGLKGDQCEDGLNDGVGREARFLRAQRLALEGDSLYVTEMPMLTSPRVDDGTWAPHFGRVRHIDLTSGEVTTIAGTIPRGNALVGELDGKATEARLHEPVGIWASGGKVYVGGQTNVRVIESGQVSTLAGALVASPLMKPGAVDRVGDDLYLMLDSVNQLLRIDGDTADMEIVARTDSETFPLIVSRGMTHISETVYIADAAALLSYDSATGEAKSIFETDIRDLEAPCFFGISTDGEKLYLIAAKPCLEPTSGAVWEVDPATGDHTTLVEGPQLVDARGLSYAGGQLYVGGFGWVARVDRSSASLVPFVGSTEARDCTDGTAEAARFGDVVALAGTEDALLVADADCHSIRRVDRVTRQVTTLVGDRQNPLTRTGYGSAAGMNYPRFLALDPDAGVLYISDPDDNVVLALTAAGQVPREP